MDPFIIYNKNKEAFFDYINQLPRPESLRVRAALEWAEQFHAGQQRTEGNDYVIHCVRSALWLAAQPDIPVDWVIAALLHDTLEDTSLSPDDIKHTFGEGVLTLVQAVTRPRPDDENEEDKQINKPRYFQILSKQPEPVRLVKTADLLDNMRSWQYILKVHPHYPKFPRWFNEAEQHAIPLARSVHKEAAEEMEAILATTQRHYDSA